MLVSHVGRPLDFRLLGLWDQVLRGHEVLLDNGVSKGIPQPFHLFLVERGKVALLLAGLAILRPSSDDQLETEFTFHVSVLQVCWSLNLLPQELDGAVGGSPSMQTRTGQFGVLFQQVRVLLHPLGFTDLANT